MQPIDVSTDAGVLFDPGATGCKPFLLNEAIRVATQPGRIQTSCLLAPLPSLHLTY